MVEVPFTTNFLNFLANMRRWIDNRKDVGKHI